MDTSISAHGPAPLLVVLGPTGAGKSDLALTLARRFSGEIVNCDSVQVYRGLDIGSAKTPLESRRDVPHHLLDVAGPGEELTAGAYARMAREAIGQIHRRGSVPIVSGGTGFYLRALLEGLSPAPRRNSDLRQRLRRMGARRPGLLHRVLRRYDRLAAERIHANDVPKLIRAIEIMLLSGQSTTEMRRVPKEALTGVAALKVGLSPDRNRLYSYLNERTKRLFQNGLVEETRQLINSGYRYDSKPLQSLGYKQAIQVIAGNLSFDSAVEECRVKTRQYAKRQMTWFRAERNVHWLHGFGSDDYVRNTAVEESETFLAAFDFGNDRTRQKMNLQSFTHNE